MIGTAEKKVSSTVGPALTHANDSLPEDLFYSSEKHWPGSYGVTELFICSETPEHELALAV